MFTDFRSSTSVSLLALLLCFGATQAQTGETANDPRMVEYEWSNGLLSDILPFDHPFVIKVNGIPDDLPSITATIYEVRSNFGLFRKQKRSIDYDEFRKMRKVYQYILPEWKREKNNSNTYAYLQQPYPLKPNSNYIIEFNQNELDNLTTEEEEAIANEIRSSDVIYDIVNKYVNIYRKNPNTSFARLNNFRDELNVIIKQEVSSLSEDYRFKAPPDESTQLQIITKFVAAIIDAEDEFKSIAQDSVTAETSSFVQRFRRINFGNYVFDKAAQKQITDIVNSLSRLEKDERVQAELGDIADQLENVNTFADRMEKTIIEEIVLKNTYVQRAIANDYELTLTRQANHMIGLDFGGAYVGNFERIHTYSGVNIYLRPVNKNIPLSRYKELGEFLLTRSSLLFGMTLTSVAKEDIRKGIVDDKGLILGAGFRIVSFLRVNAGGLIYYRIPNNPLVDPDRYKTKVSPFVSLSFDLDVKTLFGSVNGFFPAEK